MALNGIIFGGVVVLWAAFLVPWALRRYDEAMSERPIETFSDAMRVLGRRAPAVEPAAAPATRRSLLAEPPINLAGASVRQPSPAASRAAARAAAARRRRVLLTLLATLLVVGVLAAFSVMPLWSLAIPAGLVVAWLVLCRVQVRSEDAASWRRRGEPARASADPADAEETVRIHTGGTTETDTGSATNTATGSYAVQVDSEPVREADLAESTSVAVPAPTTDGSSLWDPLPVTLPTYVSKPRATRSIRTIDLGAPGTWTSGHVDGEQTEMPAQQADAGHRRAVGD